MTGNSGLMERARREGWLPSIAGHSAGYGVSIFILFQLFQGAVDDMATDLVSLRDTTTTSISTLRADVRERTDKLSDKLDSLGVAVLRQRVDVLDREIEGLRSYKERVIQLENQNQHLRERIKEIGDDYDLLNDRLREILSNRSALDPLSLDQFAMESYAPGPRSDGGFSIPPYDEIR